MFLGAALLIAALGASPAAAATTRYAAPGGSAADTVCVNPTAAPCSIETAAEGPGVTVGDEVVIAPGNYSDAAGDLGADSIIPVATSIHGESGQPRPKITLETTDLGSLGAFWVQPGVTISHLEFATSVALNSFTTLGGTVEDVISRSGRANGFACTHTPGLGSALIRDSVCLSTGASGIAVGTSIGTFAGTHTAILRNVTAIATGTASRGLSYDVFGAGVDWDVSAKSVIARGTQTDAFAGGKNGADTAIAFEHSNYATTDTGTSGGGIAAVTPVGSDATNQTDSPLLAADGYHQLGSSPTVEAGDVDVFSGTTDIDGQARVNGLAADIGADEFFQPIDPPSQAGSGQTTATENPCPALRKKLKKAKKKLKAAKRADRPTKKKQRKVRKLRKRLKRAGC